MTSSTVSPLVSPTTPPSRRRAAVLSRMVIVSSFVSAWLALAAIFALDIVFFPDSTSVDAMRAVLPLTAFLAIAAVGQMLVIMTGGIDLSVPAVVTMSGTVILGLSHGSNDRLGVAVAGTLVIAALIGLVSGILVAVVGLNSLIVTLSVGSVTTGLVTWYRSTVAQEANVPGRLSAWTTETVMGVSLVFLVSLALTILMALCIRYTLFGRRFQAVGGNPRAARAAGISVIRYQVAAFTTAGLLYGVAGVLLAGFVRTPNLDLGAPYLLGPIAAVVIAGTSLRGGVASAMSTFAAALFLTQLSQTLRIVGLSSAWQFIVFGAAIALGMLVSGDRILALVGGRMTRAHGSMAWRSHEYTDAPD